MHIYLPPGYEKGQASHPVLYLLHGGGDSDDSWTSVGRANFTPGTICWLLVRRNPLVLS